MAINGLERPEGLSAAVCGSFREFLAAAAAGHPAKGAGEAKKGQKGTRPAPQRPGHHPRLGLG